VRTQAAQTLLDGGPDRGRREIEKRLSRRELLARLGDDDPVLAPARQQPPEPLLAAAIGWRGIEQVDPQPPRFLQPGTAGGTAGQIERARILHAGIAADLH